MHPISWLHISDIHLREQTEWQQDVVLKALINCITEKCNDGLRVDFILVTGDIAFSGKPEEYVYAAKFFDSLSTATNLSKDNIFCVPGNHDIDISRQKLCFLGARQQLQDSHNIDSFLTPNEDLKTLLLRQSNFRKFQNSYFENQKRNTTNYELGYSVTLDIRNIKVAIIGLDSSWLAQGGSNDLGKLSIGDKQISDNIEALNNSADPCHITIGMAHHPLHHLIEFEKSSIENKIIDYCDFFHSGHLHEPNKKELKNKSRFCHFISAGASFETRMSKNSFSIVKIDLENANKKITSVQYQPSVSKFESETNDSSDFEISSPINCTMDSLAHAFCGLGKDVKWPYYFAALLLGQKTELPIQTLSEFTFGTIQSLKSLHDGPLTTKTISFINLKNLIPLCTTKNPINQLIETHSGKVLDYSSCLAQSCERHPLLTERLEQFENDSKKMGNPSTNLPRSHSLSLLHELAGEQNWELLLSQSLRHIESDNERLKTTAMSCYALALCKSEIEGGTEKAASIYRSLLDDSRGTDQDVLNYVNLLFDSGKTIQSKKIILDSLRNVDFHSTTQLIDAGREIAMHDGDRDFREKMSQCLEEREKREQ